MNNNTTIRVIFSAVCVFAFAFIGCENANEIANASWSEKNPAPPAPEPEPEPSPSSPTQYPPGNGADEVNFSLLNWTFGNFNGSRAVNTGVQISHLAISKDKFSFQWDVNMSAWGYPQRDHAEYCAWFVKKSDGTWVGGKFDWIRNSNNGRDFGHINPAPGNSSYNGWTLAGVPNPCESAFVVIHGDGKRRSNVLHGMWTR